MQEQGNGVSGNTAASATSSEHSATAGKKPDSAGGYESLNAREVQEARMRAQQQSKYEWLRTDMSDDLHGEQKKNKKP